MASPAAAAVSPRPASLHRSSVRQVARAVPGLLGGTMDGFVAGFAVGYVATTAVSGANRYLGLGTIGDVLVTLLLVLATLGAVWGLLLVPVVAAGWARDRVAARLADGRGPRTVQRFVLVPLRIIAGVPRVGIGLIAAVLILVYGIVPVGIGGLVGPEGALAPWAWFAGFVGALLGLARTSLRREGRAYRVLGAAALAGAMAIAAWGLALAVAPGTSDHLVPPGGALDGTAGAASATLADPGATGAFAVTTFTYGSGTDRREAFGSGATLRTPTVDASRALDPLGGLSDEARAAWWGFGRDALPLNARVWMPEGDGPFPLVLVVHGNHAMGAPNEAGYAYLAEHLASRGFITASVDESFLNGSWAGDWGGAEMKVRAWLLLLHLDQWRSWNAEPGGMLEGRVDLDRVALIGHSRGGEAASVAAASVDLRDGFDPTLRPWPEDLGVDAVVSIAPSDGQIGRSVRLDGVDFLTLTGGHDADARAWSGIRQYNRTAVEDGGFKAALYAQRANHGQFNTVWGAGDQGPFSAGMLNLDPLLDGEAQQDVARTSIGAFLEASLHGRTEYRDLFRRPMVGREWLPDDVYAVRSDAGDERPLVTMTSGGSPEEGLTAVEDGLASARAMMLPLRALQDTQEGRGVVLRWDEGAGTAGWGVEGIASSPLSDAIGPGSAVRLELANGAPGTPGEGTTDVAPDPVLEARTTDGVTVRLPLSTWGAVPPPLVARLTKDDLVESLARVSGMDLSLRTPAEQVATTWRINLADFAAADPAFRPEQLDALVLRIPRTSAGSLAVTGFGLLPAE
jgi:dienelactone hydrolase